MKFIRTLLIDDEQDSTRLLQLMLSEYCPAVKVEMIYNNPHEALVGINKLKPDLLFLDIEMPGLNGFTLLEQLNEFTPAVIFLTAYNQYAINAFKVSALDYLLKPLQKEELIRAVDKYSVFKPVFKEQLNVFKNTVAEKVISKIAIPANSGTIILDTDEILYIEADKNYSTIHLAVKKHLILRSLKEIEQVFEGASFYRIHRQYIVNTNFVQSINRTESTLMLSNGICLPVARQQKKGLESRFTWL